MGLDSRRLRLRGRNHDLRGVVRGPGTPTQRPVADPRLLVHDVVEDCAGDLTPPKLMAGKSGKGGRPNAHVANDEETPEKPPRKGDKGKGKKEEPMAQTLVRRQPRPMVEGEPITGVVYRQQWNNQHNDDDKSQDTKR